MIFQQSKEQEAMQRWASHEFLEAERGIAKWWRQSLTSIDLDGMAKAVMGEIGPHWRKPKSLKDARTCKTVFAGRASPHTLGRNWPPDCIGANVDKDKKDSRKSTGKKGEYAHRQPAI
jgi:hypothetical protein